MSSNFRDPTEHGGPANMLKDMVENPQKYGRIKPLPERGKGNETRIARDDTDMNEVYRRLGYSMPIAQIAEMAGKYGGFMRDANVDDLDEKAAILDALSIHRMIITSECVQRKARYEAEENEAQRWLDEMTADRRPQKFHFDPYLVTNANAESSILQEYLQSLQEDQAALESDDDGVDDDGDDQDKVQAVIPHQRKRGRPRKEEPKPAVVIPTVDELVNKWGACDAYMFQVLLDEERHGIDYAEQHYDTYEKIEDIRRNTEFLAALLPPPENAFFWCRVRQLGIIRERSYDVAMGFPIHDYSDVLNDINSGKNIHDLAAQMDWSFDNAYRRLTGSMMDGTDHRTTMTAMIAQQIPLSPQLMQMMQGPPPAYWQGQGWGQPGGGPDASGEEQVPRQAGRHLQPLQQEDATPAPSHSRPTPRRPGGAAVEALNAWITPPVLWVVLALVIIVGRSKRVRG